MRAIAGPSPASWIRRGKAKEMRAGNGTALGARDFPGEGHHVALTQRSYK